MPSVAEILTGLARISNAWMSVAIVWHAVVVLALIAVALRFWQPSLRSAALAAGAPVVSASVFAWIGRNPFNGTLLAVAAFALAFLALRLKPTPPRLGSPFNRILGACLLAFGLAYPHFVQVTSPWLYLFGAPVGLIPCPSLSITIGVGLVCDAFGSRRWGLTAAAAGAFYGVVGIARLGVWIDVVLLVGSAELALRSARSFGPVLVVRSASSHGS